METTKEIKMNTSPFSIADYLDTPEMIASYLNQVLAEGTDEELVFALNEVSKAVGMTKVAQAAGLSRPSLYKALAKGSKPQFSTIMRILRVVGGKIEIKPSTFKASPTH